MSNASTYAYFSPKKSIELVIGQVQSGKTRYMINRVEKAIQNDEFDVIVILGGTNNLLLEQTRRRFSDDIESEGVSFLDMKTTSRSKFPSNKTIAISLKGDVSLKKLLSFVKNESNDKRFLILDDESDFGGVNTSKTNGTTLFKTIREIIKMIDAITFVSITATPYADILAKDSFNFDKIKILKPNSEYTGITYFENSDNYIVMNDDNSTDSQTIFFWVKIITDHIRRTAKLEDRNSQLLVNTNLSNAKQKEVREYIIGALDFIRETNISDVFPEIENKKAIDIIEELTKNTFLLNQSSVNQKREDIEIIIGGSLVSRGFTFNNLITAVMINAPKKNISADTLLQRARWFGYRKETFENLKVYVNEKVREAYTEAMHLQELVYNYLDNHKTYNKEEARKLILSQEYNIIQPTGEYKNEQNKTKNSKN